MKTKLSPKFWLALSLFGLVGQVAWVVENMYLNVFIYKMFHADPGDISLMVAASAVAATLTTVLIGALSDKIGRRKLFMCGGYILWGLSIFAFALVRIEVIGALFPTLTSVGALCITLVIVLDCLMTFFGSSANDAAYNAWLTDSTDATNRGAAEGINSMMPLVAILAVFGGFMAFDLNKSSAWVSIFAIIGIAVIGIGVAGLFLIEEPRLQKSEQPYLRNVVHGFLPSVIKKVPGLYLSLAAFILFNIAIQIFMPYLIIYYEVSLGMQDYVLIMAPAIVLASLATAFFGKLYDKKGFTLCAYLSLIALCTGFVVLYLTRTTAPVFLGSLLMMSGYLCGMAVFGARIRDLTPEGEAGRFQGVRIFSQVLIPGIVGPFIGKTVLKNAEVITGSDGTESFVPNANIFLAALVVALLTLALLTLILRHTPPRLCRTLTTPFEEDNSSSFDDYPRPQLRRDSYLPLCGPWELSVKKGEKTTRLGTITVPFAPESRLSGIERPLQKGERYYYEKTVTLPQGFCCGRVLLHFGAVDQIATLSVNGNAFPTHVGGYLPFSFDVTDALIEGENRICVEVQDDLDTELGYGKQQRRRGGMWYTPISGIWQSVWMECVPKQHIRSLKLTPTTHSITLECEGGAPQKTLTVKLPDGERTYSFEGERFELEVENPVLWSPDRPYLYDFTLTDGTDTVHSYFALREFGTKRIGERTYLTLNGEPIFCNGVLDQGYFSDGIYLPATPKGYLQDILSMKELGFNMLRKHIKIEPELFYYYCDRHGMLVFQDMVNSGNYHFIIDTALPTLGLKSGITHRASPRRRAQFESDAKATQRLLYNHPSVVQYTIFNEGWGQYDADRIYAELKESDPTRVYDATSGWFRERESDFTSEHVYFKKLALVPSPERPLFLSEFGGYSCKISGHAFTLDKTYGYRFFENTEQLSAALYGLYTEQVLPTIREAGLCATVLTQLSDVEDETNGLWTYDRQVLKVDKEQMRKTNDALYRAFAQSVQSATQ